MLRQERDKPGVWPKKDITIQGNPAEIDKAGDTFKIKFADGTTVTVDKVTKKNGAGGIAVTASDVKADGPGTKWPSGQHFGYWKVFQLANAPTGCSKVKIVQLKKVTTTVTKQGGKPVQAYPKGGAAASWEIDGAKSDTDPSSTGSIPGEPMSLDAPGWIYPKDKSFPAGELKHEGTYRTWIVCCNPLKVLGYFEWSIKVVVQIKPKASDSSATVDPTGPDWHDYDPNDDAGKDFDALVLKKFPKLCD